MNPKMEALLKKHAAAIAATRRELAMNFDIPARDLIQMACYEMGISEKQWRAMESYSIARDEADRDAAHIAHAVESAERYGQCGSAVSA